MTYDTLHKHTLTETHLPVTLIPASSFTNACAWPYLQNTINIKPGFYRVGGTWTSHVSKSTAFGAGANRQREGRMPACTSTSGRYLEI